MTVPALAGSCRCRIVPTLAPSCSIVAIASFSDWPDRSTITAGWVVVGGAVVVVSEMGVGSSPSRSSSQPTTAPTSSTRITAGMINSSGLSFFFTAAPATSNATRSDTADVSSGGPSAE
jgi:hypothetical protein